jgi:hypothetical protein
MHINYAYYYIYIYSYLHINIDIHKYDDKSIVNPIHILFILNNNL